MVENLASFYLLFNPASAYNEIDIQIFCLLSKRTFTKGQKLLISTTPPRIFLLQFFFNEQKYGNISCTQINCAHVSNQGKMRA